MSMRTNQAGTGRRGRVRAASVATAALALLAAGGELSPARAGGLDRGTANIAVNPTGWGGDGRTYDNSQGDEVSFGTKGPFPGNFFFLTAGPRSMRSTYLAHGTGVVCAKTIFSVSSASNPNWYTQPITTPAFGRARLLCEPGDGRTLEYRWGYDTECVSISGSRATFVFEPTLGCVASVTETRRGSKEEIKSTASTTFRVDATPNSAS